VTAPSLPSPLEVRRHVAQVIGKSTYSWPSARLLPMHPHEGTKKIVSHRLLDSSHLLCVFVVMSIFSETFCVD
jgi:hypothetical protein